MTLGELAVVLGITGTVSAIALPFLSGLDDARAAGAARYMSSRLADARLDAIAHSRKVALRFTQANGAYSFSTYVDGNGNGVLAQDIARGVDPLIAGPEKLTDNFKNVDFGAQPGVPPIDSGSSPAGDPIKLGASNSVSFNPLGTSTTGTIYIIGKSGAQYAVRIFGTTGRIRVYRFSKGDGKWLPMSGGFG
jgi:hypothetical protein